MNARRQENRIFRILVVTCVLLALGFGGAWAYREYMQRQRMSSSYTNLKPIAISQGGHSIAATFAVKTSDADLRWAVQNRLGLEAALHEALLGVDPQRALAPGGLRELQRALQPRLNARLATDKVQEVVITDFLVSEGDF